MRSVFATKKFYADINTLEHFDKVYNVYYSPTISKDIVFSPDIKSDLYLSLKKKLNTDAYSLRELIVKVANGEIAVLTRENDSKLLVNRFSNSVHLVKECIKGYLLSYISSISK